MSDYGSVQLEVFYDFSMKEFSINFESKAQARAYQAVNPEARILSSESDHKVWLPMTPTMKYLRYSSLGLVIVFENSHSARAWEERSVLGKEYRPEIEQAAVYIARDWRRSEFGRLLKLDTGELRPPSSNNRRQNPSPGGENSRRYQDYIEESLGSRAN